MKIQINKTGLLYKSLQSPTPLSLVWAIFAVDSADYLSTKVIRNRLESWGIFQAKGPCHRHKLQHFLFVPFLYYLPELNFPQLFPLFVIFSHK